MRIFIFIGFIIYFSAVILCVSVFNQRRDITSTSNLKNTKHKMTKTNSEKKKSKYLRFLFVQTAIPTKTWHKTKQKKTKNNLFLQEMTHKKKKKAKHNKKKHKKKDTKKMAEKQSHVVIARSQSLES